MRKLLYSIGLPVLLFLSVMAAAQEKTISGRVTDAGGKGIMGVSVTVKGQSRGTITSENGSYTLSVPSSASTLVFSSVGYGAAEMNIGNRNSLNVTLQASSGNLNEIVVVGYGTQRKKEVTGAIAKVGADKIVALPTPSFEASLQGRVAGVQVSQSSGLAGAGSYVRIRGIASVSAGGDPLYVVDGIPITSDVFTYANAAGGDEWKIRRGFTQNPLASIDPNDIESVEVLKDAGAAGIYGSRGSNGVIIITTKRGKSGKPTYNFSSKVGFSKPSVKTDFVNTQQWIQLRQEAWENDGNTGLAPLPNNINRNEALATNTDWFDALTQTGIRQEYNLSMNQGSQKFKSYVGATYSNDESYAIKNKYTRYGLKANLDYIFTDQLKASLSSSWFRGDNYRVASGWAGGIGAAMSNALPFYKIYDENGNYWTEAGSGNNPLFQINSTDWRSTDNRFINGLSFDYNPIKNLTFHVNGNTDYLTNYQDYYEGAYASASGVSNASRWWAHIFNYNIYGTATYMLNLSNNNKFTFMVGSEYQKSTVKSKRYDYASASSAFWKNESLLDSATVNYPAARPNRDPDTPSDYDSLLADIWKFTSYFGRVNYSYKDKLFLQALIRADGSSKFGPNNRFGFFPAVSAAYVLSEEHFIKDIAAINYLKLRTSYGITGNSNIPSFKYIGQWTYQTSGSDLYGGNPITYPNNYANPDLKWEQSGNFDAGVEFTLFKSRLSGDISFYYKKSKDVLMEQFLSESSGYGSGATVFRNLGKVENKGVEFSLNLKVLSQKDLTLSLNFNAANNSNKVLDVEGLGPDAIRSGTNETRIVAGYPLGTSYTLLFQGVDPADGSPLWLDKEGKVTKTFDIAYRRPVGKLIPDWTGGFGHTLTYKNFDFTSLFVFSTGLDVWDNSGKYQFQGVSTKNWNFRTDFLDRWTKPGDQAHYPRLYYNKLYPGLGQADDFSSSLFLYQGDYMRLRELTLGYRFSPGLLSRAKIRSARVFVTGMNLLLWTKYPNGDPEVNRDADGGATDRNMSPNVTYLTPPQAKTVTIGLNLNF